MEIQGFSSTAINNVGMGSMPRVEAPVSEANAPVAEPSDEISLASRTPLEGKAPGEEGSVRSLRLVHINDLHGAVEPDGETGGLAKVATVIKQEQSEKPGATLTLNAGDLAEGSMVAYLTKGRVVSEALGQIPFDAVEPGNHDFAWGQEPLQNMLGDLNAPVLNASISYAEDGKTFGAPYLMKEVNGVKIGMIGVDVQDMARYVSSEKLEGLQFDAAAETVAKYIPQVKAEGADLVMVVSHIGFEDDKKLAQAFPDIDVIVGGHSHTELPEGHYEGNTLIVQEGTKGQFVGEVDLDFDLNSRKIVASDATLIPVDGSVEPDADVASIIQAAEDRVAGIGARVMGVAEEELTYSHSAAGKLNQIHADSVKEFTGADIVLVSARNLRGNLEPGEVTYEKLFSAFPHTEEDVVVMKAPGRLLLKEMEERVADGGRGPATPAGWSYSVDKSKPDGERICNIRMADGSKFDPDREYTVGTTISMSRKKTFKDCEKKSVGSSQEVFMDYFEAGATWRNDGDNRVDFLK